MSASFGTSAEVACHVIRSVANGAQNSHITISASCKVDGLWLPGDIQLSWIPGSDGAEPDVRIRALYTDAVPTPTLEAFICRSKVVPKTFRVLQDARADGEWHIATFSAAEAAGFVENILCTASPYKPTVVLGKKCVVTTTSTGMPQVNRVAFTRPDIRGIKSEG